MSKSRDMSKLLSNPVFTGYLTSHRSDPRIILNKEAGSVSQYGFFRAESDGVYNGQIGYDYLNDRWTIGENGGAADKAIVEYGTNANGEYIRFYNGVQIVAAKKSFSGDFTTSVGSLYTRASPTESITWPAAFAADPYRVGFSSEGASYLLTAHSFTGSSATTGHVIPLLPTSTLTVSGTLYGVAVGAWY